MIFKFQDGFKFPPSSFLVLVNQVAWFKRFYIEEPHGSDLTSLIEFTFFSRFLTSLSSNGVLKIKLAAHLIHQQPYGYRSLILPHLLPLSRPTFPIASREGNLH